MLARAKKTPIKGMTTDELKAHRERLRERRDARRADAKRRRYADAGLPPPEPKIGRPYGRINFRMPVMPEDSKPSWAAEGVGDRRLWCQRYDACLSYAACLKWPGFDCGSCSVREEEPPTARVLEGMHVSRQDEIREVLAAIRRRN